MPDGTTCRSVLAQASDRLQQAGIEQSRLDARVLLEFVTGWSHAALISNHNTHLTPGIVDDYRGLIERRINHEPVHRITGSREFYGRPFTLSAETLVPRPETELLVDLAVGFLNARPGFSRVLDIGTGSGAIAISIACEVAGARVMATDISVDALASARANASRHGVLDKMGFCQADVLEGIAGTFDLIVSNPPYIPSADIAVLDLEVRDHDPIQALDGGSDGLEFYRRIISGAGERLAPNGALLLEFGIGQSEAVSTLAREGGFSMPEIFKDLAGLDRAMLARTRLGVL